MASLMDVLFGCSHKRITFPITVKAGGRSSLGQKARTYVVCLDCGKEFQYDWADMKLVSPTSTRPKVAARTADRAA